MKEFLIISRASSVNHVYIKEGIDGRIERCRKGTLAGRLFPVYGIVDGFCRIYGTTSFAVESTPRESRLLREADTTFVRNLKLKMVQDPSAPGATPIAVLCKDVEQITEFNMKHKNVYKYEVLGGLRTL